MRDFDPAALDSAFMKLRRSTRFRDNLLAVATATGPVK